MIANDVLLPQMKSELRNLYCGAAALGRNLAGIRAAADVSKHLAESEQRFCQHVERLLGWKISIQVLICAMDSEVDIAEGYKDIYREWLMIAVMRAGRHDLLQHFSSSSSSQPVPPALAFGGTEAPSTPTFPKPDSPSPARMPAPEWKRATSPNGSLFEYNVMTGETRVPLTRPDPGSPWVKSTLPDGKRVMWHNKVTDEIRFTDPHSDDYSSAPSSAAPAPLPPPPPPPTSPRAPPALSVDEELKCLNGKLAEAKLWKAEIAECGTKFYYNTATNQSQWFPPAELLLVQESTFKQRLVELQSKLRVSGSTASSGAAPVTPGVPVSIAPPPQPPQQHSPLVAESLQGSRFNLARLVLKSDEEVKQAMGGFNSLVESRRLSKS